MEEKKAIKVPVEVSARHCHLSKESMEKLFGNGYELKRMKQLGQPADFAAEETVDVVAGSKKFEKVRVVGPLREQTQIEISMTDAVASGITPPVRLSGDLKGSSGALLFGPAGQVELSEGLIIARRHLHCSPEEVEKRKLKQGQIVSIEIKGPRAVVFHCVEVRIGDGYKLCAHLDTDEGNAAGIDKSAEGFLIF